ncbi:MAG TPA: cysteine peptidase family C39 domain-containing protein [Bacteriovoracaceae bacterium]|nr:cysteine peptidase family C39 domain-containing protein [Bacteriovoracaceae bacterium]
MHKPMDLPYVGQTLPFTCAAACFESMYQFLRGASPGELHWASELGTMSLGYTPPVNVYLLGVSLGFTCRISESAGWGDLLSAVNSAAVIFVTWWDEDARHYSLLKGIDECSVILMDPLTAFERRDNILDKDFFLEQWKARGSVMIHFEM